MIEFYSRLLEAMIFVLPAYIANATPVISVKNIGRSTPLDRGMYAWDNKRILGDGKTVEGLISGILVGALSGIPIYFLMDIFRNVFQPLVLSIGAMIGDILGSFVKRRIGLERGRPLPPLDQLGFLISSLFFSYILYGLPAWASLDTFAALLVITFFLHLSTNYIAYFLRLKDRPY
ncbi:MAG: CDP-2,3-bis-(O-geranylgeranyl)-sn-glycerol synthase [Nitrososphaerota archaeon]